MQCEDCVVCYDPYTADGGVASVAADLCVNFTGVADPIPLRLNSREKNISIILKTASDAGTTCRCKFANTHMRSIAQ